MKLDIAIYYTFTGLLQPTFEEGDRESLSRGPGLSNFEGCLHNVNSKTEPNKDWLNKKSFP